jgi:hypothetical protein
MPSGRLSPAGFGRCLLQVTGSWLSTCADYHRAARHYEVLWRVVDAELARLGISRRTLAQNLCEIHDRMWGSRAEQKPESRRFACPSASSARDDAFAHGQPKVPSDTGPL